MIIRNSKVYDKLILLIILKSSSVGTTAYSASKLFPDNEEYELTMLNPETMYGSPYGGFSRASSSRLAKLPLLLHSGFDVDDDDDDMEVIPKEEANAGDSSTKVKEQNEYFHLSDAQGRKYSCKGYKKEELEHKSVVGSVFDMAIEVEQLEKEGGEMSALSDKESSSSSVSTSASTSPSSWKEQPYELLSVIKELYVDKKRNGIQSQEKDRQLKDFFMSIDNLLTSRLSNICAQLHQGWWSYNYCFRKAVTQFHIATKYEMQQKESQANNNNYGTVKATVETLIELGRFTKREYLMDDSYDSQLVLKELYDNGDDCEVQQCDNNDANCHSYSTPRTSTLYLSCCESSYSKSKAALPNTIMIEAIEESATCAYTLHACTPLICPDHWDLDLPISIQKLVQSNTTNSTTATMQNSPSSSSSSSNNIYSIRDILRKVLGGRCLTRNEGWWTYEFCYGKHVRQFHSQTIVDPITSKHRTIVESQHKLGYFHFPLKPDSHYLINTTSLIHYQMEYSDGDTCLHTDVTEAVVGGHPEGIERSTTLKFSCGTRYEILSINEDSTCHYVMEVTVPDLCHHESFIVHVQKEDVFVVKCLPLPTDSL